MAEAVTAEVAKMQVDDDKQNEAFLDGRVGVAPPIDTGCVRLVGPPFFLSPSFLSPKTPPPGVVF